MKSFIKFTIIFIILTTSFIQVNSSNTDHDSTNTNYYSIIDDNEVIIPSSPTDVFIVEEADYKRQTSDERPEATFRGLIYWERLGGSVLNFFLNTSDVIDGKEAFWDYQTKEPFRIFDGCVDNSGIPSSSNCVRKLGDRYLIVPDQRSFTYEITAYYDPDIVEDTGFIVIFNSQSVDFSINVDGQQVFAKVDYRNQITLPTNAGVISKAPLDDGYKGMEKIIVDDGVRWQLTWEYKHRALDSKHDPLIIEVTYSFDDIYLKFTEQIYQNQVEQQKQQDEENRLNLLNASFVVIASLALIASIFSIFLAYLIARKKFESDLQKAKELPRRAVSDIEKSDSLQIPTKSLILTVLIFIPLIMQPTFVVGQIENDRVIWNGVYDLRRDLTLTETVQITLPVQKDVAYIYTNVSDVDSISVVDEFGSNLQFEPDPDGHRYKISNPTRTFTYIIDRPYKLHNGSDILVYLDRFWIEFVRSGGTFDDQYFHVDLVYTVLLPEDAILYSASPTQSMDNGINLEIIKSSDTGRYNITWVSNDRQMDAFHDPFELQISFSFIGILDALENLNSNFVVARQQNQDLDELIQVASDEILLFSILGIIAPLISFFIAYWVFRNRYKKKIAEFEKQQEEQIFVESTQISALVEATSSENTHRLQDSHIGHYWRLKNSLSNYLKRDISLLAVNQIMIELKNNGLRFDEMRLMELINLGESKISSQDDVDYGELHEFATLIDEFLDESKL